MLVSPLFGFALAAVLLLLLKSIVRIPALYAEPEGDHPPPWSIREILILTCTLVSFFHGSNDGQKGMGLIMLILIGILPTTYAVDTGTTQAAIQDLARTSQDISGHMDAHAPGVAMAGYQVAADELSGYLKTTGQATDRTFAAIGTKCLEINELLLKTKTTLADLTPDDRKLLRGDLYLTSEALGKLVKQKKLTDPAEQRAAAALHSHMDKLTKFIPVWVKIAVALALGLGTMIGWKRIVVTVGEKIGKTHLTYAQGASAEMVAAATVIAASQYNLPVSTTHVLSSGVAGTMAANHSGLQMETLRNLLMAWVLTLPAAMVISGTLYWAFSAIF